MDDAKGAPKPKPTRGFVTRWSLRFLKLLLGLIALAFLTVLSAFVALQTRGGRAFLLDKLAPVLSTAIPGKITVGSIDEARLGRITLRDVVILDPEGNEVIRVGEARVSPDFGAILQGKIDLSAVDAKDVEVALRLSPRGSLSIVDAFVEPTPEEEDTTPSAIQVFVRAIRIDRGRVRIHVLGDPPIDLVNVAIRGSVTVTDATRLLIDRLDFDSERADVALLRTRGVRGAYRSAPGEHSRIALDLRGGEDVVRLDADARNPARETDPITDTRVRAHLALAPITSRLLAALDQEALAEQTPTRVTADIHLSGAIFDARLRGFVRVNDETISLEGSYRAEGESRAKLCTAGATLSAFYGALPEQRIHGCFEARIGAYSTESMAIGVYVRGAKLDETLLPDLDLNANAHLERQEIEILGLDLPNVPKDPAPKIVLTGRIGFEGEGDVSLSVRGLEPGDDPAIEALLGTMRGRLDARAVAHLGAAPSEGAPSPIQLALDATVTGLRASDARAERSHVVVRADGTTASPRFDVRGDVYTLSAGGFRAEHTTLHAHGSLARMALDVQSELGHGRGLVVHATATSTNDVFRGNLRASAGTPNDAWGMVVENATYDTVRKNARIPSLRIAHEESEITASASLRNGRSVEANVHIAKLEVHDLLRALGTPIRDFTATLAGDVTVGGTTSAPTIHGELALEDTKVARLEGITAQTTLDYGRSGANVGATVAVDERVDLVLAASATWPAGTPISSVLDVASLDASLDVAKLDLTVLDLVSSSVLGLAGELTGDVRVQGSASAPEITVDLTAEALALPVTPVRPEELVADLDARWADGLEAHLATRDVVGDLLSIDVRLDLASAALVRGELVLSEAPFEVSATLAERPFDDLPFDIDPLRDQGMFLAVNATVEHSPGSDLQAEVEARMHTEPPENRVVSDRCGDAHDVEMIVHGGLDRGETRIDIGLSTKGTRSVELALTADTPVDAWLSGTATPALVAELTGTIRGLEMGHVPVLCEHARGTLDASLRGHELGRPSAKLELHAESAGLSFGNDVRVALEADVTVQDPKAQATIVLRSQDGGRGDVTASLPFTLGEDGMSPTIPDGEISANARFHELSLEPIAGITPFVRRRAGTIDGHIAITGTLSNPVPNGEIRLHDVSVLMPGLEQRLSELEAHVSIDPSRIVVHELRARDVRGRVSLTGEARFEGNVPMRLEASLEARDFPVRQEGLIIAEVTSNAELSLVREEGALRGALEFQSLNVHMPDELRTSLQDLEENHDIVYLDSYPPGWTPPEEVEPEPAEATSEVDEASTFVPTYFHIDMSTPFWIRRSDFAIELSAELDLGVEERGLRLSGTVHTRRGFIDLLGNSFDIEEGTVRFPGGTSIDPVLDLTAMANKGRPNEVTVRIKGTVAALELKFYDKSDNELTAGLALQCITTAQCSELGDFSGSGNEDQAAEQQAQNALASLTVGLLTAAARHGIGDAVPRIGVSTGGGFDAVTARVGFEANKLIPKFLRAIVLSLYIEGFVSNDEDESTDRAEVQERGSQVSGGFLVELRHPRSLVTRGRFAPRSGWSLDITWQR